MRTGPGRAGGIPGAEAGCRRVAAARGNTPVSALGVLFNTGAGQHILKNPLVVNSIIDKVGAVGPALAPAPAFPGCGTRVCRVCPVSCAVCAVCAMCVVCAALPSAWGIPVLPFPAPSLINGSYYPLIPGSNFLKSVKSACFQSKVE